jgi:predicted phage-related endonuclease
MTGLVEMWPRLSVIGLSEAALADRRQGIGGSDANIILSGDPERVLALWREKRGEGAGDDLASVLPVMLGQWTEAFNRQWYVKVTGLIVGDAGSTWTSQAHRWRRATLDGLVEAKRAVWEAKHVSAFAKPEEVLARYMPQLQHNMAVAGVESAVLSVLYGNHRWEAYEVASDWLYQDELLVAEQAFWTCVLSGEPPVAASPPAPPKPVAWRELCLDGNNGWAVAAADWIENVDAARKHAAAVKALKEAIPEDVSRAWGHGLEARRSKSGAVSFKIMPKEAAA